VSLTLKKSRDGEVTLLSDWPDEHRFSSDKFAELALTGCATMEQDPETGVDIITLTFGGDSARYEVLSRPGEDDDFKSSWNLVLTGIKKGKKDIAKVSEKIGTGVKLKKTKAKGGKS
jgi:hypothetical protein